MKHYIYDLNENGSAKLYCKIVERPLSVNPPPGPAIMWIPGGGFAACAPEDGESVILARASHGYCGFTMTYPAGVDYRFPDILILKRDLSRVFYPMFFYRTQNSCSLNLFLQVAILYLEEFI